MTAILKNSPFFAGFAVDDLDKAREFYRETPGVEVIDVRDDYSLSGQPMGTRS
jgi:catechol 2,3-dioxygenase-like lactoylglutathione lyase family enzyme